MEIKKGTVCFIVSDGKVLLALIQYPDGKRLWNGIGGIVDADETPQQAVSREISEETKLVVTEEHVKDVKTVEVGDLELHILIATIWSGEESIIDPTLKELRWFDISDVPYDQMHVDNDKWLPEIFNHYK